jgi:hypothetical protein
LHNTKVKSKSQKQIERRDVRVPEVWEDEVREQ